MLPYHSGGNVYLNIFNGVEVCRLKFYILHMTIFTCIYEKKPNSYCFIKPFIALSGLTCLYLNNLTASSVLIFCLVFIHLVFKVDILTFNGGFQWQSLHEKSKFHLFFWCITLRKKCPYSELFWSAYFRIRTEYREIRSTLNSR